MAATAIAHYTAAMTSPHDRQTTAARHGDAIRAACRVIESATAPPRLADLAQQARLSRFHFQRVFKQVLGLSPDAYYQAHRARRLAESLQGTGRVDDAIYAAGFGSPSRVYERSDALLGMTPALFRRGAPGLRIRYALSRTSVGLLLAAATDRGICAVDFGDSRAALEELLRTRFHAASIAKGDAPLHAWVERIVAFIEHPEQQPDVPLDLAGTAFQLRVWQALRSIAPGSTLAYAQLAAQLGMPRAVRAVASACARNPVAVAVPCHRALGSDGSLSGYRWGLPRKQALLDNESAEAKAKGKDGPRRTTKRAQAKSKAA